MTTTGLMKRIILSTGICFLLLTFLQAQPQITLESFAEGLNAPTTITHANDNRIFVVEQTGKIQIVDEQGNINEDPFLDIEDRISYGGEKGLLGLAFHPDYQNNGLFYVNYSNLDGDTHVSEFSISESDPDLANPDSEQILLTIDQPYSNHNGGEIRFGPDGYLYIATGDGGSAGDPENRAQNMTSLLGKMLRIDVDGVPYQIPPDNPFVDTPDARDEIWSSGMRNPWRFSFDRETGDLWIADVGQNEYEEVNFEPAESNGGLNYGWRCYEGNHEYDTDGCQDQEAYTFPVHEYSHSETGGCSVTGGFVYRGEEYPNMQGHYFFADYCNDKIWTLYDDNGNWETTFQGQFSGNNFATFGEDASGELYVAGLSTGTIYKIMDTSTTGINSKEKPEIANAYPNPFTDFLKIQLKDKQSEAGIKLSSLKGKVVYSEKTPLQTARINTKNLTPGVYLLKVTTTNETYLKKVIKK
jgi:glucose/arabinose dehydrogenase